MVADTIPSLTQYADGISAVFLIGWLVIKGVASLRRNGNGNGKSQRPGETPACLRHESRIQNIESDISDVRSQVGVIEGTIKNLHL